LRERLGEAGYATVAARFSIDAQVRRIEALYAEELVRAGVAAPSSPTPLSRRSDAPVERASLELPPL
jgi:hypothetical protein